MGFNVDDRGNFTQPPNNTGGPDRLQVPRQGDATTPSQQATADTRRLRPVSTSTSSSLAATTPGPIEENRGDYFEAPSHATSLQPRVSAVSSQSATRPPSLTNTESRPVTRLRRPSIRIRRTCGASNRAPIQDGAFADSSSAPGAALRQRGSNRGGSGNDGSRLGRSRSASVNSSSEMTGGVSSTAPGCQRLPQLPMPRLTEEGSRPTTPELGVGSPLSPSMSQPKRLRRRDDETNVSAPTRDKQSQARRLGRVIRSRSTKSYAGQPEATSASRTNDEYDEELVNWLDIIDPEVQALSTLTNVQNSLFVPDLGAWLDRRPRYVLSQRDTQQRQPASSEPPTTGDPEQAATGAPLPPSEANQDAPPMLRSNTITSQLTDSHYATLPHNITLDGWTAAEKYELDDHVRHMLHSRRSKFKRSMKGFGQYVRRPLGFLVTLYATLITLFGLAWVLFLIGWIYVGEKQVYDIHVIDSVLVALFAIMGDGLAPFRAIDTYHMIFVARYSRRLKKGPKRLPSKLVKRNIPPAIRERVEPARAVNAAVDGDAQNPTTAYNNDIEEAKSDAGVWDESPLTAAQQKSLEYHQTKLDKSHSFYKPHETYTHHAFPLSYLIAIVVLLDCHSCLQISLGACTWGIDYHVRPFALTTVILCVSITCNLTAGLVITLGDRKTRKKDVVELLNRRKLTEDAMKEIRPPNQEEKEGRKREISR